MISPFLLSLSLRRWIQAHPNSSNTLISKVANTNTCNALLRGELSAIETYTKVIDKFGPGAGNNNLTGIRANHVANAESLRQFVGECGDEPATRSGLWGSFAVTLEGVAAIFGETPALMILKQGEEHGIRKYMEALDNELSESFKDLVRDRILPTQRKHLVELVDLNMKKA